MRITNCSPILIDSRLSCAWAISVGPAVSSHCVLAVGSPSVTIYRYQTRYQSRNIKSSCSSRHKTRVWEDFREGGSLVSICLPMSADSRGHRPDCPLESPWKRLRVHDDVKAGLRSVYSDTGMLI